MILPTTAFTVLILAIVSLLCLGSWANTLKLAGKWRFEYFYYDFVFGILLCGILAAVLLGSGHPQELTFQDNLTLAGYRKMAWALAGGVVLNLGTLLLVAAMAISSMSVAFGLTLGVALVISAVWDFTDASQANTALTFMGIALVAGGVVVTALAYIRLLRVRREAAQKALTPDPRLKSKRAQPAGTTLLFILSVVAGIAISTFPRFLSEATFGDNGLAPYSALVLLSISAILSSPFFVLFFTTFPVASVAGSPKSYLAGNKKQHLLGVAGGIVWGIGLLTGLLASTAPRNLQPGFSTLYSLNNGALIVAAGWGLLAWRDVQGAGDRVRMLSIGMMVLFIAGLGLVAFGLAVAK